MAYKTLSEWKNYFHDRGIDDTRIDTYLNYASVLIEQKLPVIFEIEHLSLLTEIELDYLYKMMYGSSSFYRTFYIPKKHGKEKREITTPYPSLKHVQQWINKNILSTIRIHDAAHGFVKNKSIITNTKQHVGQNFFLKIDLKNFFPSIPLQRVVKVFQKLGYANNLAFALGMLCCKNGVLTQGSPTSPALSNAITYGMDVRIAAYAKNNNLVYTRYADDIALSGDEITKKMIRTIFYIIEESGFVINPDKVFLSHAQQHKRILTGLSISGNQIRIPRKLRRELKQIVFYIDKHGYKSHLTNQKIRDPRYYESLYGKLNFWKQVEPDSIEVHKLIEMLEAAKTK